MVALAVAGSSCKKRNTAGADLTGKPSVILLTDSSGIDDKSFNAAAWKGILQYYDDAGLTLKGKMYDFLTCQGDDSYIPNMRQTAEQGWDLIIANGWSFAGPLETVAPEYPQQKFMITDVDYIAEPNVMRFLFREEQGAYLVGLTAALQAQKERIKNPRFGFIGGIPGSTITKFEIGYIQGIKSVLSGAEVIDFYVNDWAKPELAKTQAKIWYDEGVYSIFCAAGASGNGAIAQAKEYRSAGRNVWVIGVDIDQYEDGIYAGNRSAVLTSMIKRVDSAVRYALKSVERGTFTSSVITLDFSENGVDYSKLNPELAEEVISEAESVKKNIINGDIRILGKYKDAMQAGIAPAGLGARDND